MWYECVPTFGIMVALFTIPMYTHWYLNKAVLGTPFKRDLGHTSDRRMYERDDRISGFVYKLQGLEAIPDD